MPDIFLPKVSPVIAEDRYKHFSRAGRLAIGSQYVVHIDEDGGQQVLYMKFQNLPEEIGGGLELNIVSSGPVLFGMVSEFNSIPKEYTHAQSNSRSKPRGSRFVVDAVVYDVEKIDTHHLGGIQVGLIAANNCHVKEMQFYDHVRPYICLEEQG